MIAQPVLTFMIYIIPFLLVGYVASGWGYAISCCLPISLGAFISAILAFMMGGALAIDSVRSYTEKGSNICSTRYVKDCDITMICSKV